MIDRKALVTRHDIILTEPNPRHAMSLGNGDFGMGVDVTGLQTFLNSHDPTNAMRTGTQVVNTATQSTWGWHSMPNPKGWQLADAMSEHESPRGPVKYPDKFDMRTAMSGQIPEEMEAGVWLNANPQRLDLGRIGLVLGDEADGPGFSEADLSNVLQRMCLWSGQLISEFDLRGQKVSVRTCVHPQQGRVAIAIESELLTQGLGISIKFPYASTGFFATSDWNSPESHQTSFHLKETDLEIWRKLDGAEYSVSVSPDISTQKDAVVFKTVPERHSVTLHTSAPKLELVVTFSPQGSAVKEHSAAEIFEISEEWWQNFWQSGAAISFDGTSDSRASELERRVVLSQYLTAIHSSGSMPPQETGLMVNSWQGKAHLEMHFWHAAHFAAWGRPGLLLKSLKWYLSIAENARETASLQGYEGLRWPKAVGPTGIDSPSEIGPFLIWQQPHLLYLLELLDAAGGLPINVAEDFLPVVIDTANFMVSFLEERADGFHLPAPLIPAQEFYDPKETEDPTFELAYWWWGLELAARWSERFGADSHDRYRQVQRQLVKPNILNGRYTAIATQPFTKRDDHPSLLGALGFVPPTPIIDAEVMRNTLKDVLADWDWDSAWGWDFPLIAMNANALGETEIAVDALLSSRSKNHFLKTGHNPQLGNILPIYLPGNGSLLAAISQMVTGSTSNLNLSPGFPKTWNVQAEGFVVWPA